jgi:hypothetical protein
LDAVLKWSFSPLPLKHCLHFPTSSPEFLYLCPCHDQLSRSTRILEGVIHLASEEERPLWLGDIRMQELLLPLAKG